MQEAGLGRARQGPSRARESQEVDVRADLDQGAASTIGEVVETEHVRVYQHTSMVIDVQTNVPEPFNPALDDHLKEGIPVGLSDAQVHIQQLHLHFQKLKFPL